MAKINRFYLLVATLVMSKTYSATAAYSSGDVPSHLYSIYSYCGKNSTSPDVPCAICVPFTDDQVNTDYTGLDDFLDRWYENGVTFNGTRLGPLFDTCAPVECSFSPSTYPVFMLGARSDTVDGYYWECTTDGWTYTKETQGGGGDPTPTCKDKIVYNGTFTKCCNPTQSGSQWKCSSYSEKFCNSGYYGTFNGRSTDCTACPTSNHQIAGSNGGKWFATGRYASVTSNKRNNTSISTCYVAAGSTSMIDDSGVYIFTGNCGY